MMSAKTLSMIDDKYRFVNSLSRALRGDSGLDIKAVEYHVRETDADSGYIDERIVICYKGGGQKSIDVSGNSNVANMVAIGKLLMKG